MFPLSTLVGRVISAIPVDTDSQLHLACTSRLVRLTPMLLCLLAYLSISYSIPVPVSSFATVHTKAVKGLFLVCWNVVQILYSLGSIQEVLILHELRRKGNQWLTHSIITCIEGKTVTTSPFHPQQSYRSWTTRRGFLEQSWTCSYQVTTTNTSTCQYQGETVLSEYRETKNIGQTDAQI